MTSPLEPLGSDAPGDPGAPPATCPHDSSPSSPAAPKPPEREATPLYGPEFSADPYAVYDRLRAFGPMAPVEISPGVRGLLITDYRAALDLLHDTDSWSRDPTLLDQEIPADSPLTPLSGVSQPTDDELYRRYRDAMAHCWDRLPPHELRRHVVAIADALITEFSAAGEADLISQYARDLPLKIFNRLFGMPDAAGDHLVGAVQRMMEADDLAAATAGYEAYTSYIQEAIAAKKQKRGDDFTSWLLDHPAELSDEEITTQIGMITIAGNTSLADLIGNALGRMLSDDRYYGTLSSGALTARDALQDVLRNDPPLANMGMTVAKRDLRFHGRQIRKGQLMLVSYAACNVQHGGRAAPGEPPEQGLSGGGAHLAFGAGTYACPAQNPALLIAATSIERLTAWFPDMELTLPSSEIQWRNATLVHGLLALPVRFSRIRPDQTGPTPWNSSPIAAYAQRT